MKNWFLNNWLYITGAVLGSIAGYIYWSKVGCSSGSCAITSKPINSTLYFGMIGALVFGMFKKSKKAS